VVAAVVAAGCNSPTPASGAPGARGAGPLKVTTTIGMIADIASVVGGEHVAVTGLMGPGVDPHLYKATQGDLAKLSGADLILYNGLHLEGRMADVLVQMASRVKTVQVTETIPHDILREPPEFQGQYDQHVWFDVSMWKYAVERTRDAFKEMDPAHAADFDANADDIEVLGLQGISTAAEYGLQDVDRLVETIVARKIRAVFIESSISPKSIEALVTGAKSRGHDLVVGGELFSDAMGKAGTPEGTYLGMVRHNVDTIVKALQ
jgi:manganese/zinc/iron transport system substrate-binding protein